MIKDIKDILHCSFEKLIENIEINKEKIAQILYSINSEIDIKDFKLKSNIYALLYICYCEMLFNKKELKLKKYELKRFNRKYHKIIKKGK